MWRPLAIPVAVLCFYAVPVVAQPAPVGSLDDQAAISIMQTTNPDPASLAAGMGQIDAWIAAHPDRAIGPYVRAKILAAQGQVDAALVAYDQAAMLDARFADAPYDAALLLLDAGRVDEALARLQLATVADPTFVDAYYNAGQAYYNRGELDAALAQWQSARALAPDDFDLAKKVLQALNGLGRAEEAATARAEVLRIRHTSADPIVQGLTEFCFDQFDVGPNHVFAYETFDPAGDLYNLYRFSVMLNEETQFVVALESSSAIREMGFPYVIGVQNGSTHMNTGITYTELPPYATLRATIIQTIEQVQAGTLTPTATTTTP